VILGKISMELKRRLSLVVAIMSVALGSGHLVQNVLNKHVTTLAKADLQPMDITLVAAGPAVPLPKPQPAVQKMAVPSFAATPTDETTNLFALPDEPILQAEFDAAAPRKPVLAQQCPVSLDLLVEPSAMIGLTLLAPCQPNARVVLLHAGLAVTGKTSGTGTLFASLPAFDSDAEVSVRFADGQVVTATVAVPEAASLRRFGVQWQGDDAFQLNAFENGAAYGEIGHVSAADPQRPLAGKAQIGGFLSVLGDDGVAQPMLAEVYTYPAASDASVRIVIEAAITKGTCAREILGETLADVGGDVTITDLTLAMPDCSAVGDILVLKNLDPDLKIASAN
jgi:hypothetical protein